jgi:hypothetical protein
MRLIPYGTPSRTKEYLRPRSRLFLFWISLAGALTVAAVLSLAVRGGAKTLASPGRLSSGHAPFEEKCSWCHSPAVADVRCERCHDPFGSNRYRNAGHIWFGTNDPVRVAKAVLIDCARCHSDHRGRDFLMTRIDERDCSRCHFSSMSRHPEFALVKAGVMKNEGLKFTHDRHVAFMTRAHLEPCQFCHEPTRDRRGFEALSFDRHCARCHAKDGAKGGILGSVGEKDFTGFTAAKTDPIKREFVLLPQQIDAPWARSREADVRYNAIDARDLPKDTPTLPDVPRKKIVMLNPPHRDSWTEYNLWKLSREVDPKARAAQRARLVSQIEQLQYQLKPTGTLTRAALKKEEDRLSRLATTLTPDPRQAAQRRRAEQDLARVRVELELGSLQMTAPRPRDRAQLETELAQRQAYLAYFDIGSDPAAPLSPDQRQDRLNAVQAMILPCAKCHLYNGSIPQIANGGVAVLARAKFNHLPHVQQLTCESCHSRIQASHKAEDVNLPGIAKCQTCHRTGKSRADCAECHRYHPPSEPWPPI